MGTEGLILQIQSREEILADKWVALAFRPNRIKYRDIWDLFWLHRQGVAEDFALVLQKLDDRQKRRLNFETALGARIKELQSNPEHERLFRKEMERFLPAAEVLTAVHHPQFWTLLTGYLHDHAAGFPSAEKS